MLWRPPHLYSPRTVNRVVHSCNDTSHLREILNEIHRQGRATTEKKTVNSRVLTVAIPGTPRMVSVTHHYTFIHRIAQHRFRMSAGTKSKMNPPNPWGCHRHRGCERSVKPRRTTQVEPTSSSSSGLGWSSSLTSVPSKGLTPPIILPNLSTFTRPISGNFRAS